MSDISSSATANEESLALNLPHESWLRNSYSAVALTKKIISTVKNSSFVQFSSRGRKRKPSMCLDVSAHLEKRHSSQHHVQSDEVMELDMHAHVNMVSPAPSPVTLFDEQICFRYDAAMEDRLTNQRLIEEMKETIRIIWQRILE